MLDKITNIFRRLFYVETVIICVEVMLLLGAIAHKGINLW